SSLRLAPTASGYSTSERLAAESLPRSRAISYLTFCPSLSELRPARSTALMWTNTSLPPSLGSMNPKPFWRLNHLTVPVAILASLILILVTDFNNSPHLSPLHLHFAPSLQPL